MPMDKGDLFQLLRNGSQKEKWFAAEILGFEAKQEDRKRLEGLVNDPDVDEVIVWILGQIGNKQSLPALLKKLKRVEDTYTIHRVVEALIDIGKPACPYLRDFLSDTDNNDEARWRVAQALGELKDEEAFSVLWNSIDDPNRYVRWECTCALAKLGREITSRLETKLSVNDPYLRWRALWILGEIGAESSKRPIKNLLNQEESPFVRWQAKKCLQKLDST